MPGVGPPRHQHHGGGGRAEEIGGIGRHRGVPAELVEVAKHNGQRLFIAVLAGAQHRHGGRVGRVAHQVVAAHALDRKDGPVAEELPCAAERILALSHEPAVGLGEAEVGAADRARVGLGVKAPAGGIVVFALAVRALAERAHGGVRAVVGQALDEGVTRAALRAVDERIAMTPVGGVEEFAAAVVAEGEVGRDGSGDFPARTAEGDGETRADGGIGGAGLRLIQGGDLRGIRGGVHEGFLERRDPLGVTGGADQHALGVVAHPACEAEVRGGTVHERPVTHALHGAANADQHVGDWRGGGHDE